MAKITIEMKRQMSAGARVLHHGAVAAFNHMHNTKSAGDTVTITTDQPIPAGTHVVHLEPAKGHDGGLTISGTV